MSQQLKHTAPRLYRFFLQALAHEQSIGVDKITDILERQVSTCHHNELLACKDEDWAVIYSSDPHTGSYINVLIPSTLELTTIEVKS